MSSTLIEGNRISYAYDGVTALHDVSISINKGERFFIIGRNGAGKSTLLKIMADLLTSDGSISVAGQPLGALNRKNLARNIAYTPQPGEGGTGHSFRVFDFVMMGRYPFLSPFTSVTDKDREAVKQVMERTGVAQFADRPLGSLSGGERQKVAIAAAIAQEPKALLLDEPTAFLDPKSEEEIIGLLTRLNQETGVTLVTVTHDINLAALFGDTIMGLRNGLVEYVGPPSGLMQRDTLAAIYGKDFLFASHPVTGQPVVLHNAAS